MSFSQGNTNGYGDTPPAAYASYGSYGSDNGVAAASSYMPPSSSPQGGAVLRRRHQAPPQPPQSHAPSSRGLRSPKVMVKKLDFMYTKVEREYTVQTERGGRLFVAALALVVILCLAEIASHYSQVTSTREHISVDTSLGKRMKIQLNITFPALACEDLHVDAMNVAGDSQIDLADHLVKIPLHLDGTRRTQQEIQVELNAHQLEQAEKQAILKKDLAQDYCGSCYGAQTNEGDCCQTCDDVLEAYKNKKWNSGVLMYSAEQCIREGRDKREPKRMTRGQGCNLSGWMQVNRVAGNFHIAMGEGIERDGRHIHSFVPEDTPNFNASHIIHKLDFGPSLEESALRGVTKIVTTETGTTGLFQYFIKVVPTTYTHPPAALVKQQESNDKNTPLETNRYFVTERFRPLMVEYLDEHKVGQDDHDDKVGVHAGGGHGHDFHKIQNSVLPGVFFIYEIYPFAVEISPNRVPFTHLLVQLMATIGGVFALTSWADQVLYARDKQQKQQRR